MAVADLTITSQREEAVDFSLRTYLGTGGIAFKVSGPDWLYVLKPLNWLVWIAMFGVVIVSSTFLYLLLLSNNQLAQPSQNLFKRRFTTKYFQRVNKYEVTETIPADEAAKDPDDRAACHKSESAFEQHINTWMYTFLLSLSSIFLNNVGWLPNSWPARIYLSFFWFVVIVVTATYTANLVATLTSQKSKNPFRTLEDIAAADSLTLLVRPDTSYRTLLETSKASIYARLWNKVISNPESMSFLTREAAVIRMLEGPSLEYGVMSDNPSLKMIFVTKRVCQVRFPQEEFFPSAYGVTLPHGSPYIPFINDLIQKLDESGYFVIWKRRHWPLDECDMWRTWNTTSARTLGLEDLRAGFAVLGIGLGAAALALLLEFTLAILRKKVGKWSRQVTIRNDLQ